MENFIDYKYKTHKPNIFNSNTVNCSRFWKGVMTVVKGLKLLNLGLGREKVRFWEDTWFGTSPLAVQYWNILYYL
jgi:hypothetical protein